MANIVGKKIILRAIEETDLDQLHIWSNQPELWSHLGGWHFPYSKLSQKKWFESLPDNDTNHIFAIETPDLGLIGTANLINIDWKNRHAFHGMMLGDKNIRGKGYGIDTIHTICKYAFNELNLHRLDGNLISSNQHSYHVYVNKCGWKVEGRRCDWFYRDGQYWDKIILGITWKDYNEFVSKT